MKQLFLLIIGVLLAPSFLQGQAADWQNVIWRDPQVRYLLADMTGGGKTELYRKYATEERDPDSSEAVRLWDAGVRVLNMGDFERKWVTNQFGQNGRVFRVVQRGSDLTITGTEVLLSNDAHFQQATMRLAVLNMTWGASPQDYAAKAGKVAGIAEAVRRFAKGCRASNAHCFERSGKGFVLKGTRQPLDPFLIKLNSDLAYSEVNVRYFLADMMLGGSRDFYHRTAEAAHEMGCQEAVARFDGGVKITNLDQFERKKVDGKMLITRKGSNERIKGMLVKLSTDL